MCINLPFVQSIVSLLPGYFPLGHVRYLTQTIQVQIFTVVADGCPYPICSSIVNDIRRFFNVIVTGEAFLLVAGQPSGKSL